MMVNVILIVATEKIIHVIHTGGNERMENFHWRNKSTKSKSDINAGNEA